MIQTFACIVFLFLPAGDAPAGTLDFSAEAERALDLALKSVAVAYREAPGSRRTQSTRERHAAAKSFATALDDLADNITEEQMEKIRSHEGDDIRAKLAVMAKDRRHKIDMYENIEDTYVATLRKGSFTGQVTPPPRLVGSHLTEPYQLVWEYYLLSPMPEGATPMYVPRVLQALSVLRDDASVVSLLHCFELTCGQQMPEEEAAHGQKDLLDTLAQFRTAAAARGLLTCVELAAKQPASSGEGDWDVEEYVYERLTEENAATASWQPVLESLDREGLTERQSALLERALGAYR